jgi:thiamine monophosphate synthase
VVCGTVFPSASKPGAVPTGVEVLRRVVDLTAVPVLAIGGVTERTVAAAARAGASGVAAIGWLTVGTLKEMCRRVDFVREAFDTL